MSNRASSRIVRSIALLAALASPAFAGVKQVALKQLADGSAAVLKQLGKALGTARGPVDLTLGAIDEKLKLGTLAKNDLVLLYADLETMQVAVRTAVIDASDQMAEATMLAMQTLDDADIDEGDYPRGFLHGDGGTLDDFRLDVDAKLRKHYAKLRTRLAKLSEKLEQANFCLTVRIDPPMVARDRVASPSTTGFSTNLLPLTADLVVGIAEIEGATTGDLRASGTAFHGQSVDVSRFSSSGSFASSVVVGGNDRWKFVVLAIVKHDWCVRVSTQDGVAAAVSAAGLR